MSLPRLFPASVAGAVPWGAPGLGALGGAAEGLLSQGRASRGSWAQPWLWRMGAARRGSGPGSLGCVWAGSPLPSLPPLPPLALGLCSCRRDSRKGCLLQDVHAGNPAACPGLCPLAAGLRPGPREAVIREALPGSHGPPISPSHPLPCEGSVDSCQISPFQVSFTFESP